jgi:hypothetical protein
MNGRNRGLMNLTLVLGAMASGCKETASPPTGFGVNIIVNARALSPSQRSRVVDGLLEVTGAETVARWFSVKAAVQAGEIRFRYVPNVRTGVLSFTFVVFDSADAVAGVGHGGPVTLTSKAASVTILLAGGDGAKRDGAICSVAADCTSGFCADGVCCNEGCGGACESCALPNSTGLCAGYDANTDPEMECGGAVATSGGSPGAAGGGAGTGGAGGASAVDGSEINSPDGGAVTMPEKCAGSCDGHRACAYPAAGSGCGDSFCNTHREIASFTCDGKGNCQVDLSSCVDYACNPATAECRTQCAAHTECVQSDYCSGLNQCVHKKKDSLTCAADAECVTGHCASGVCCNTACDAPAICNTPGAVGLCTCPGVTCATGIACQVYYQDADVDGYGNRAGTIAAATAKAACAGAPPPGFVADNTDCDDGDANVHPGQTNFFGVSSKGVGTFDFDCSGSVEKESPEYPAATCKFCGPVGMCEVTRASCTVAGQQAYLSCALGTTICAQVGTKLSACSFCGRGLLGSRDVGFTTAVACGVTATFTTCGTCSVASGTESPTTTNRVQRCH